MKALVDHLAKIAEEKAECLLCIQNGAYLSARPRDLKDWAAHIKRHLLLPEGVDASEDPVPTDLACHLGWNTLPGNLERKSTNCAACGRLVSIGSLFTHQKTTCKSLTNAIKNAVVACPCPVCQSLLVPAAMSGHIELLECTAEIRSFACLIGQPGGEE